MFLVEYSGFDVCLSVGVDLVGNLWKKMGKIINFGHFRGLDFSIMAQC